MTSSLNGNTLVLFQLVEKHGEVLYTMMKDQLDKNVVFIHGGVETDVREVIRETAEKINDLVIVASYGTYSTGINIKNLHNIVFASPSKSPIRVLQSIGRGLRKGVDKNEVKLFDISSKALIHALKAICPKATINLNLGRLFISDIKYGLQFCCSLANGLSPGGTHLIAVDIYAPDNFSPSFIFSESD